MDIKKKLNILIVDDEEDIHSILEFYLEKTFNPATSKKSKLLAQLGSSEENIAKQIEVNIEHAFQGEQALEMVNEKNYDFIVLDIFMPPGINGVEFMSQLEKDMSNTTVIVSSAYYHDLRDDIVEHAQSFKDAYLLAKPYSGDKFSSLFTCLVEEKPINLLVGAERLKS
jgi:two-component system sensor histidine kinase/response regulator